MCSGDGRATCPPLCDTPALGPCMEVGAEPESAWSLSSRCSARRHDPAADRFLGPGGMASGENRREWAAAGGPAAGYPASGRGRAGGSSPHRVWGCVGGGEVIWESFWNGIGLRAVWECVNTEEGEGKGDFVKWCVTWMVLKLFLCQVGKLRPE